MAWLLILGGAMLLLLGLALLPGRKPATPPLPPRRRDPGGSGVWMDDHDPAGGLQLDKFGHSIDPAGLVSNDHSALESDFEPDGGRGGGGGASGGWDDGDGGDGGGD